jgi:membrane protease YdiL (CAAX protease family)
MATQTINARPANQGTMLPNWFQRAGLFLAFLACYVAVIILGSNYFDIFPTNRNLTYNLAISAIFLITALWFKSTQRLNKYWQITFAFFMASVVYPVTSLTIGWKSAMMSRLGLAATVTSQGTAVDKLFEVTLMVVPILVLSKLSGADLGSIFIKRGSLKLGLGIGGLVFLNFSTSALMFFATRFQKIELLGDAIVWGLVFSLANGFMEELWIRGIFLRRLAPFLGIGGSVWLTATIFALMHGAAYYFMPAVLPIFIVNTMALGLACGYLIMKTDSIWGAALIHAAADLFLFIAILSNAA